MAKKIILGLFLLGVCLFTACTTQKKETENEEVAKEEIEILLYEAEEAILVGAIIDSKHAGFTGTGFVDYKPNQPGGTISWNVEILKEGDYILIFRYAHETGNRPLEISVNNTVIAKELEFQGTGDWAKWEEVKLKSYLMAGSNTIIAKAVGFDGGGNIDSLKIVPNNTFSAIYEAEFAKGTITIIDSKHAGYTGEGFVDFKPNQPGGTIEWEIEVPRDGVYTLQFRYAHESGNRPLSVEVNGIVINKSLDFMGTGDWAKWETVNTTATLTKGKNKVLVTSVGSDGGGNIDSLKVIEGVEKEEAIQITIETVPASKMLGKTFIDELAKEGLFIEGKKANYLGKDSPGIESAIQISDEHIMVTFNNGFLKSDPKDLGFSVALGGWASLNPKLSSITAKEAAIGTNKEGKSVFIYLLENPISKINTSKNNPAQVNNTSQVKAKNLVSWQLDNGGWDKNNPEMMERKWNGTESKAKTGWVSKDGTPVGTIDNDATIKEIRYIAEAYRVSKDNELKDSLIRGINFILKMQQKSGGFTQVYPERAGGESYSNLVTFNDNAMMNVLILLDDIANNVYPFDSDFLDGSYTNKINNSLDKGVEFILRSQIKVDGALTAWCAQHDPITYEPKGARTYEHPSISGSESVGIVKFLIGRKNKTPEVQNAIDSALIWFENAKVTGQYYAKGDFIPDPNGVTWYRFYDLKTMEPIFSGRDGVIKRNILDIEDERRLGYSWAGTWPQQLLNVMKSTGYFEGKMYAQVVASNSSNLIGQKLVLDSLKVIE